MWLFETDFSRFRESPIWVLERLILVVPYLLHLLKIYFIFSSMLNKFRCLVNEYFDSPLVLDLRDVLHVLYFVKHR